MKLEGIITPENSEAIIAVLDLIFCPGGEPWAEARIGVAGKAINDLMLRFHEVRLKAGFKRDRIRAVPKHVSDYLETGKSFCPYPDCNGEDIVMRDHLDSDGTTEHWMEMTCNECQREFTDHYKLVGVTLDKPVEEKKDE